MCLKSIIGLNNYLQLGKENMLTKNCLHTDFLVLKIFISFEFIELEFSCLLES